MIHHHLNIRHVLFSLFVRKPSSCLASKPDFLLAPFTGVTKRTTRPCEPREIERLRERKCIYRERHREIERHRVEVRGGV
ncbi:hypothetical protein HanHA89_Chr10g0369001 [Helianthus annuus]|nr:hypothetical protein HanHA89_Chr10g0369001 [Helianthus annuus]